MRLLWRILWIRYCLSFSLLFSVIELPSCVIFKRNNFDVSIGLKIIYLLLTSPNRTEFLIEFTYLVSILSSFLIILFPSIQFFDDIDQSLIKFICSAHFVGIFKLWIILLLRKPCRVEVCPVLTIKVERVPFHLFDRRKTGVMNCDNRGKFALYLDDNLSRILFKIRFKNVIYTFLIIEQTTSEGKNYNCQQNDGTRNHDSKNYGQFIHTTCLLDRRLS